MEPKFLEILEILYTELSTELTELGTEVLWIGCIAIVIPIVAYWRGHRWWIWQLIVLGSLGAGSLSAPFVLAVLMQMLLLLALLLVLALPVLLVLLVLKPDAFPRRWRRGPLPLTRSLDKEGQKG